MSEALIGTGGERERKGAGDMLTICFTADAGYLWPTLCALRAIAYHHNASDVRIEILLANVGGRAKDLFTRAASALGLDVRFRTVPQTMLAHIPESETTPGLFLILFMGELLPRDAGRVLYLDGDVHVRGSLIHLAKRDLGAYKIGAVLDLGALRPGHTSRIRKQLGIMKGGYFNSGVLLFDLETFRAHVDPAALMAEYTANRHLYPFPDQCLLNRLFADQWYELGPRYNLQSPLFDNALHNGSLILHFSVRKPWLPNTNFAYGKYRRWYHDCVRHFGKETCRVLTGMDLPTHETRPPLSILRSRLINRTKTFIWGRLIAGSLSRAPRAGG